MISPLSLVNNRLIGASFGSIWINCGGVFYMLYLWFVQESVLSSLSFVNRFCLIGACLDSVEKIQSSVWFMKDPRVSSRIYATYGDICLIFVNRFSIWQVRPVLSLIRIFARFRNWRYRDYHLCLFRRIVLSVLAEAELSDL